MDRKTKHCKDYWGNLFVHIVLQQKKKIEVINKPRAVQVS